MPSNVPAAFADHSNASCWTGVSGSLTVADNCTLSPTSTRGCDTVSDEIVGAALGGGGVGSSGASPPQPVAANAAMNAKNANRDFKLN